MKKLVKYLVVIAVIGLLGYKSVYFKKLSEVKAAGSENFDAVSFVKKLWDEKMNAKIDNAVELPVLIKAIATDKEAALNKYTNAMGIGNYRYAIVKAQGIVVALNEDEVELVINLGDSSIHTILATEYIYGNAIRDASALLEVKDFPNSADLNSISEELNSIVRKEILPPFKTSVKKGNTINITAAIELNKQHIKWAGLELIPLRLEMKL
jgi:predicted lipoprotein